MTTTTNTTQQVGDAINRIYDIDSTFERQHLGGRARRLRRRCMVGATHDARRASRGRHDVRRVSTVERD
jgi:hypothetical protein